MRAPRARSANLFTSAGKLLYSLSAASNDVTAGYALLFTICGSAYLFAFAPNHALAPSFESV